MGAGDAAGTGPVSLDESSLTGESLPVSHPDGEAVASGTLNVGQGLELTALRAAVDSTYAAIVRLVRQLFALEAILRLHFDQENELYAGLAGEG